MVSQAMAAPLRGWAWATARLQGAGEALPALILRLIMGWEFWESGLEKLNGSNWFGDIQDQFPFPFNVVPASLSWFIATWFELIGAVLLWLGLGTRMVAFSLLFLTFVATAAVHWPDMVSMWADLLKGYAISDKGFGNYKLPLLFSVMLLPLIFSGAGRLSLDHWLARAAIPSNERVAVLDLAAWALAAAVLGLPFLMLVPAIGAALLALAAILGVLAVRTKR